MTTTTEASGVTRIYLTESETAGLMAAATAATPLRLAFGPGWVAADFQTDGSDHALLHVLADMRGVA